MRTYPVENLLREPTEIYSALTLFALALLIYRIPQVFLLTPFMQKAAIVSLLTLSLYRTYQAYQVKRYQWRLLKMPHYALSTTNIPCSSQRLFVGRGFRWQPIHTQRLHQIKQISNTRFLQRGFVRRIIEYVKPLPDVGGQSYLHGVGLRDKPVYLPQTSRTGHTFVVGTTRVGKTRLASILINQDIRNGDAVIVVDPKGDLELVRDMYSACKVANRLDSFHIVHLGFPEFSTHYNPLKQFDQISEVATRITDAINAEGEGKQFAAFAWKYANIVAICLQEMNQEITYKSIAFYISRLDQLLMMYADTIFPKHFPDYETRIEDIITSEVRLDKQGRASQPMERSKAVTQYLKEHISRIIQSGNIGVLHDQVLIDLYDAATLDKHYYDKITASVGPVLSEINKSNASAIFSFSPNENDIDLMSVIKQKKVLYIGLDSLTNPNVAQAVGKAFLSDLVSTAGKLYKESENRYRLNLHCDELSEIIQDAFVKILNKAGGAGFQVTAYAQTKQDLEVALGSRALAEVTEGNLNTLIMLRVKNEETANLLVKLLPEVGVIGHTQVSMVNDTPQAEDGIYFNTTNEDRIQMTNVPMLSVSDIIALPKGQAFVFVNGGELYKVRLPLPVNDGLAPSDLKSILRNIKSKEVLHESN